MWRELRFRLYPASASRSVRMLSCLVLVLIVGLDWLDQTQVHERLTYPAISDAGCDAVCARLYALIGTRHGKVMTDQLETVEWTGGDGVVRRARVPLIWFLKERRDEMV